MTDVDVPSVSIAEQIARFAAEVDVTAVPSSVAERAKDFVLHALAVGLAGREAGYGTIADAAACGFEGNGPSRSLVSGRRCEPATAAFVNSVHLHARAQEDTCGTFHPGITVIPAALAMSEATGCDGQTFLSGVVAGYEAGIALAGPLTDVTTPPFRATSAFGPVAAAVAAGRVAGLPPDRLMSAISLAAAMSGGTSESFSAGTDEWHFQPGIAAMIGVNAATLAAHGAVGSSTSFEAATGYLDCLAPSLADRKGLAENLGAQWGLLAVTFKPYPVCAFNQTPGMLAARMAAAGIRPSDIASVELRMNPREATYPGMPHAGPFDNVNQTLMSARFAFAAGLVHGEIRYATLRRFDDRDVMDLVAKIDLVAEPSRPPKTAFAVLTMKDGFVVSDAIEDSESLLRWDSAGVVANAWQLQPETGLSRDQFTSFLDAVEALPDSAGVDGLVRAVLSTSPAMACP